ncbi:MAG TPA: APC family permease [Kofleriaceae bacterium]|jgi:amino acid transporter|nr:APC family permease [Kofleriaceae bacterium]
MVSTEDPAGHTGADEHGHHAVGLRRDTLSFTETLAQSIANIAPTATPAINLQLVFAVSGNGTWFTYVLATLGLVFIGICINQFARQSATPGSLYAYVVKGLGPTAGFLVGWGLILAYLTTGIATVAGAASYATTLCDKADLHVGPYPLYAILAGLIWVVAYRDVRLSARMMLLLEAVSVTLILTLGALLVSRKGFHLDLAQLALEGMDLNGLRGGMVLAIFSFVGFESATALGAEAREPLKRIPQAVLRSTLIAGAFFVVMSFIMVQGFRGSATPLDKVPAALDAMAEIAHAPVLGVLVSIGAVISFFACALACVTAVSRILLAMARDGVFHASIGKAHQTNATPHVAATLSAVVLLVVPVAMSLGGVGMLDIYGLNGTIATYGFLVAYVLIAAGAMRSAARRRASRVTIAVVGAAGMLAMGLAIVGSVDPWPAAPYDTLPPIFVVYVAIGIAWLIYDRRRTRAAAARPAAR